jgi:hypothetical protein
MKRQLILSHFVLFVGLNICTYSQNLQWAKGIGGIGPDTGNSIAIDASGNVYTTGAFQGTVDFDPNEGIFNLTSVGMQDIFISKLDALGNFLWVISMGSSVGDSGYSICLDASGNIFTTGCFQETADFDPGKEIFDLTSVGGFDIFISKLDNSGNFIWAKKIGAINSDNGLSIACDASGNVYTTGYFQNTPDFDPNVGTYNLTSSGNVDIFISKLDSDGNFIWAKALGSTNGDYGYSIALDASGNVYTTGYFYGTVDFDPGEGKFNLISTGETEIFISKLNASGDFTWAKRLGGSAHDEGHSITIDDLGNIMTTGMFSGTADFDPNVGTYNLTSSGGVDIFISKLDSDGNFIWAKGMGSSGSDDGRFIDVDASNNVYTTGLFHETAEFDPSNGTFYLTSAGGSDIFISKFNASGYFAWAMQLGGASEDFSSAIKSDDSGNIFTTGYFNEIADFSPGAGTVDLSSVGGHDIFIAKFGDYNTGIATEVESPMFVVFPNPSKGVFTISNEKLISAVIKIYNIIGQNVCSLKLSSETVEFDISKHQKGIYFYRIQKEGQMFGTGKIIIE